MRRQTRFTVAMAVLALSVAAPTAASEADSFGRYSGASAGASVLVTFDRPGTVLWKPTAEFGLGIARTRLTHRPASEALASTVWPGALVLSCIATGTCEEGDYPFYARATLGDEERYTSPAETELMTPDGMVRLEGLESHGQAKEASASAAASVASVKVAPAASGPSPSTTTAGRDGPPSSSFANRVRELRSALNAAGFGGGSTQAEEEGSLVEVAATRVESSVELKADGLEAAVTTVLEDVSLFGGVLDIDTLSSTAFSVVDDNGEWTHRSTTTITGARVNEVAVGIDEDGLHVDDAEGPSASEHTDLLNELFAEHLGAAVRIGTSGPDEEGNSTRAEGLHIRLALREGHEVLVPWCTGESMPSLTDCDQEDHVNVFLGSAQAATQADVFSGRDGVSAYDAGDDTETDSGAVLESAPERDRSNSERDASTGGFGEERTSVDVVAAPDGSPGPEVAPEVADASPEEEASVDEPVAASNTAQRGSPNAGVLVLGQWLTLAVMLGVLLRRQSMRRAADEALGLI